MNEKNGFEGQECPVARTLDVIGDKWSLMIIREAFDGVCRFNQFQKHLGLGKNILATRLRMLVSLGILEVRPASDGSAYNEYSLTEAGRALFPVIVSFRQWGERYLFSEGEIHSVLVDKKTAQPVSAIVVVDDNGHPLAPQDCSRRRVVKGSAAYLDDGASGEE